VVYKQLGKPVQKSVGLLTALFSNNGKLFVNKHGGHGMRKRERAQSKNGAAERTLLLASFACGRESSGMRALFVMATTTKRIINRKLFVQLHNSERNYCTTGNRRGNNTKNVELQNKT